MNRKFALISFFVCSLALLPLQADEPTFNEPRLGMEVVIEGKQSYEQGKYKRFIKALNAEFEKAGKSGLLKQVYEKMKDGAEKAKTRLEKDLEQLRLRNVKLLEACAKDPDLEICKRVESVVAFNLSSDQQDALEAIKSLRYRLPEGKKPANLVERLSLVETRYRMMSALLEIAFEKSKADLETRIKKQEALALEKFSRMKKIAKDDPIWSERIAVASQASEARLANRLDWSVLRDLAGGKIAAKNSAEVEIAQVLKEFSEPVDLK